MNWKIISIIAIVIIVGASIGYMLSTPNKNPQKVELTETGSTLLYPVFNAWAKNYTAAKISTQATGSGAGIAAAIAGTVTMGASDAYMSDAQIAQHPDMLNIPILISSQYIVYNIPGLNNIHLTLSGPIIAAIYNNSIQYWDDPKIADLNKNISLPHARIIPVYRSDGSGDTNMFTLFLSRSVPWWNETVGYGTSVNWPSNPALLGETGNSGIINGMKVTPYSIGYVAMTYTSDIKNAGLGYAALINKAGKAVLPNVTTVMNAASYYLNSIPPDGRIAIAFAPGENSYPIATFEYVIVKKVQPSKEIANALKDFLNWVVSPDGGSSSVYLDQFYLVALPQSVVTQVVKPLINQITG